MKREKFRNLKKLLKGYPGECTCYFIFSKQYILGNLIGHKGKDTEKLYGINTEEAIGTGLFKGYIHLINGFIQEFRDNYNDIKVIGTGNGVKVFEKYLSQSD